MDKIIADALKAAPAAKALVGFDGYVDFLYHVVKQRDAQGTVSYDDIAQFGAELMSRAGRSGGFELSSISTRAGGNAPLMAAALAALEVETSVIGAMGQPGLDAAFEALEKAADLYSVAQPARTVALEFGDGKIMLGDTASIENMDFKTLTRVLGRDKVSDLVCGADLLALVNWANMAKATALWQGILEELLEKSPKRSTPRRIFVDLADLTRCGKAETRELIGLFPRFRKQGELTLGLNENEAWQLADKLDIKPEHGSKLEALGLLLLAQVDVDILVIHPRSSAVTFHNGKIHSVPGRVVEKPLLSTGGGDNFNAGFCFGLLCGLSATDAARMAVLVSSLYVEKGRSPSRDEILAVLGA